MRARRWEGVGVAVVQAACGEDMAGEWVAWAGAAPHVKHPVHVCDAGRVPARNICIERIQVLEERVHACDC